MKLVRIVVACAVIAAPAAASPVVFELNHEFSGATPPSGSGPWLRATFENAGANTVTLTLESLLTGTGEFIREWYFNLKPTENAAHLSINQDSGPTASIGKETNAFKADGDGHYDILFTFPAAQASRFGAGDTAEFTITGIDGLTADWFNYLSHSEGSEHGPFHSAAHVQGIGIDGDDSGWIATPAGAGHIIPLPGPALLAAAGLIGVMGRRRRPLSR